MTRSKTEKLAIQSQLRELYEGMMVSHGMSKREASAMVNDIIEEAKRKGAHEGTDNLPPDYGSELIKLAAAGNARAVAIVNRAREDGASDADIEEWWGLEDLQRRMVVWSESVFRLAMLRSVRTESSEDAARVVWKMFPIYGVPKETGLYSGEDRPLAQEIRGRVDRYRREHGAASIKEDLEGFSSYNAFVRAQIRKGHL